MSNVQKILLVEDDEDLSDLFALRFEINGFDILKAKDGEEGLKMARTFKPDLILLDAMLPKINGLAVCRMLKFDDNYKKIPIIMLSAMSQQRDREQAVESGADAYFIKPFDLELLLTKIKSLILEAQERTD